MKLYKLWHALPSSVRSSLHCSWVYSTGRRLNDWLWQNDKYVRGRYEFTWVPVSFEQFEAELYLPTVEKPWWREYEQYGCHEPLTSRTFVDRVRKDATVWDLGSRFGYFATLAAVTNEAPNRVHVFEASVSSCAFIEQTNKKRFGGEINVNNVFVGEGEDDDTITGDTYAERHTDPDVVKMDIEGAEVAAVHGMERTVENARPTMIIEVHPELLEGHGGGNTDQDLRDLLETYYDNIYMSFNFRDPAGDWHPIEDLWENRFEVRELSEGEYDLYQLLCTGDETET